MRAISRIAVAAGLVACLLMAGCGIGGSQSGAGGQAVDGPGRDVPTSQRSLIGVWILTTSKQLVVAFYPDHTGGIVTLTKEEADHFQSNEMTSGQEKYDQIEITWAAHQGHGRYNISTKYEENGQHFTLQAFVSGNVLTFPSGLISPETKRFYRSGRPHPRIPNVESVQERCAVAQRALYAAIYAYNTKYAEEPDNLETLVRAGYISETKALGYTIGPGGTVAGSCP